MVETARCLCMKSLNVRPLLQPQRRIISRFVVPFGLCNAGATLERVMERVLGNLHWQKCICYLNYVIILLSDFKTTLSLDNLRAVFLRLRDANLKIKPSKCNFSSERSGILGAYNIRKWYKV